MDLSMVKNMATVRILKEIRPHEGRVALIPRDVRCLVKAGHKVEIETGAGILSCYPDQEYSDAEAQIVSYEDIWIKNSFILKVKELQAEEFPKVKNGTIIMLFPHFQGDPLQRAFFEDNQSRGIYAIPHENLKIDGVSPILAAMSRCAGEIAAYIGCENLRTDCGGPGILPSDATALVLGMGHVGSRAAQILSKAVKTVHVHDIAFDSLPSEQNVIPHDALRETIAEFITQAHIIICAAVSKKGKINSINEEMLTTMQPRSIIVDVPVDEGGNCTFSHITTGVNILTNTQNIRYCGISNLPGRTPKSASHRFSEAVLPFVETALALIDKNIRPISAQTIINAITR